MLNHLIAINRHHLQEALDLMERVDDTQYAQAPAALSMQKAGAHMRHIIEFYECLLNGLGSKSVDYDARERNELLERRRTVGIEKIQTLLAQLDGLAGFDMDCPLMVRVESGDGFVGSSIGRELQALASHTVHHFAIVAIVLRLHGVEMPDTFGVAASTLRYRAGREAA